MTSSKPEIYEDHVGEEDMKEKAIEDASSRAAQWEKAMHSPTVTITLQVLGTLAALGSGMARPIVAIYFGKLVNLYNTTGSNDELAHLKKEINQKVLVLLLVFIGQWVLVCTYGILFSIATIRYTMRTRALYLKAAVSQDIEQVSESNVATDLYTNAGILDDALAEKLGKVLQAVSTVVSSMVIAFYWSWRLSLGLFFVVAAVILKDVISTSIEAKLELHIQSMEAEASSVAEECISNIRTVTACGATSKFASRYSNILKKTQAAAFRKGPVSAFQYASSYFTILAIYAYAFWYGSKLLKRGKVDSGGTIVIVIISLNAVSNALTLLLPLYTVAAKAIVARSSLKSVINKHPRLDPFSEEGMPVDALYSRLEFQDVDFAYPSRPTVKVLNKVNLTFGAGKTTAIIGPSGCGKSSIVALLERFYDVTSGSISLNGSKIEDYNLRSLRSNVRVVQQDAVLFNDTVFNNIAHGFIGSPQDDLSTEEKRKLVELVCKDMQAHDFICQLPNGYDTIVGNRGNLLSGGQRQRVAIARAIVSNPLILIFDEATSALDTESERIVQAAIDNVAHGRTTIIIAHNLATLKRADRIIVMKNGYVTEEGTHGSLLQTSDNYVQALLAQNFLAEERWPEDFISSKTTFSLESSSPNTENFEKYPEQKAIEALANDPIIDMTKDNPVSFFQSLRYIISGSKAIQYICLASIPVCFITAGVYPAQSVLVGHNIVSFQKAESEMIKDATFWSLILFVLALISFFAFFTHQSLSSANGAITKHVYRTRYFRGLLAQQMAFFEKAINSPGVFMTCLSSQPNDLEGLIVMLSSLTLTTISLISVCVLGLILSWRYALVSIFSVVPIVAVAGALQVQSHWKNKKILTDPLKDSAQYAAEVIGNIRTVSAFAMEAEVCNKMAGKMNESLRPFYKSVFVTMPLFAFSHSGKTLGGVFAFWYAGVLLTQGRITALEIWIVYFGIITGADMTSEFFGSANSIVHARSSCGRISSITSTLKDEKPKSKSQEGEKPLSSSITFDNVSFSYPNVSGPSVLQDLSFNVQQGQHIAIVGPSGSGKSTIISLLERFHQPTSGQLRLGEASVSDLDISAYRNQISLVAQDTQLFNGTVRENILLGVPAGEESEEMMLKAAREAYIHDFIVSLPEGYNTPCGRKGASFSGGQRQRLAIARALVRNPKILLLDEATSALDSASEREVKAALRNVSVGRTTIAVAHRLSTIRDADCIYVLVKGRIVERGSHEELTSQGGVYWRMCQRQDQD